MNIIITPKLYHDGMKVKGDIALLEALSSGKERLGNSDPSCWVQQKILDGTFLKFFEKYQRTNLIGSGPKSRRI